MIQTIEAVCVNGTIKPLEPVAFEEAEYLVILRWSKKTVIPAPSIRGAMRGMLSSVDAFIAAKDAEKILENNR